LHTFLPLRDPHRPAAHTRIATGSGSGCRHPFLAIGVGSHRQPTNPFEEIERAFDRMRHQFGSLDDDLFRGAVPVDVADAGDEFVVTADLPATNARPSRRRRRVTASPYPSRWADCRGPSEWIHPVPVPAGARQRRPERLRRPRE